MLCTRHDVKTLHDLSVEAADVLHAAHLVCVLLNFWLVFICIFLIQHSESLTERHPILPSFLDRRHVDLHVRTSCLVRVDDVKIYFTILDALLADGPLVGRRARPPLNTLLFNIHVADAIFLAVSIIRAQVHL